jgi:hypothetical protein
MKVCYRALLDVYSEMDQKIGEGRSYRARYAREAVSTTHTNLEDFLQPKLNCHSRKIIIWKQENVYSMCYNINVIVHACLSQMKNQVRAYFHEAKWFHKKHIPTMDEYMRIALVTSGYSLLATTSLVGMGDIVTKDAFEWLFSDPKMVRASTVVSRLMDDIVSHKVLCFFMCNNNCKLNKLINSVTLMFQTCM